MTPGDGSEDGIGSGTRPLVVLAFSGGLDTSFCVVWLRERLGADVITAVVDTGGFDAGELESIAARARELGAIEHLTLDRRREVFDRFATVLVQGNVLRGRVYPLSVAAERVVQAEAIALLAQERGASGVAHGSTGAGNDQIRFDGAFHALVPEIPVHTPIRDLGWNREQETAYLEEHGFPVPRRVTDYSVNAGLWGTTIGGKETHDPWTEVPDEMYPGSDAPAATSATVHVVVGFEEGIPVRIDGEAIGGVDLVRRLNELGRALGVGRGVHLGETILGIKGRIGFEAPGPLMLIHAHQELEKLVLTRWQSFWKDQLGEFYGQMLHQGLYYDPVMRDIEAMIRSSQSVVRGDVRLKLQPGRFRVTGVKSPFSLVDAQSATYGETTKLWSGDQAAGFARIHSLPMALAQRVRRSTPPGPGARSP